MNSQNEMEPVPDQMGNDIVVFIIRRDTQCAECKEELGKGRWIRLVSGQPLCLDCADLGCSSMQLDNPSRGFSFKVDGPLDLRMNPNRGQPVSALLASVNEEKLVGILRENADEPHAERIAQAILKARERAPIITTTTLARIVRDAVASLPKRIEDEDDHASTRRVFQALRIEINEEFTALETFLRFLPTCMNPGGRVAVLTFHSGEDRRVKKSFQTGIREGLYTDVARDVIRPSPEELRSNPRSSSAKLRWAVA